MEESLFESANRGIQNDSGDACISHDANLNPGTDIEFGPLGYSMDELTPSEWGQEFSLLDTRRNLLELAQTVGTRGTGTHRKELTALSQELEAVIRAALSAQVALTGIMDQEGVAASPLGNTYGWDKESPHPQYRSIKDFLVDTLRISRTEANRRVRLARTITRTTTPVGEQTPARQEGLRSALLSGEIDLEGALHIARALKDIKSLRPGVLPGAETGAGCADDEEDEPAVEFEETLPPEQMPQDQREFWAEHAEKYLCEQAPSIGPDELKRLAKRWVLHVDPDGQEPSERYLAQKQGAFYLGCENNLHTYLLRLTHAQNERFATRTAALADRADVAVGPAVDLPILDDTVGSAMGIKPTKAQKTLDALMAALENADQSFSEVGPNTTILATIDHEKLFGRLRNFRNDRLRKPDTGAAESSDPTAIGGVPGDSVPQSNSTHVTSGGSVIGGVQAGSELLDRIASLQHTGPASAPEIRLLACEANIIPIVLGGRSEPLDLGRGARLFTRAQRLALAARDKGCIFPGCTAPIFRCEAHHVNHWKAHGGETNVSNGALLCAYHHHVIHRGTWTLKIIDGKPWVIPPPWIDRTRTPRRNLFYTLDELGPPTQTG